MPNEKALAEKQQEVTRLSDELCAAVSGVLVDYRGINVADDTKLRRELREADVRYAVVKNSLLRFAAEKAGLSELHNHLEGTTALAYSKSDYVAPARILAAYAEKSKTFQIKIGFVDGKPISEPEVKALAKLPSREVLVAQVLGSLNAPIAGFANVLSANLSGLARVLSAVAEQKSA